jgi:hypothetical protein
MVSGCTATNTQPTSKKAQPSPSSTASLTEEQRAEVQAFDMWLAGLILPLTAAAAVDNRLGCPNEGDKIDITYYSDPVWSCAQWTFQVSSTGKVNGGPLSGAAMVTANPPPTQVNVMTSWSCAGTVYKLKSRTVARSGANSSAGTIERSQIRISAGALAISDADRANNITWQGTVFIKFVERISYSAQDFSTHPTQPPGVGQWSSYSDMQSYANLALQNGKLVTSDHKQIVPGTSSFSAGYTSDSDFSQCVRAFAPWVG